MGSAEFSEWQEYYILEPFGVWRENWHCAQIAALTYNTSRAKNTAPVKTQDFMYIDPESAEAAKEREALAFFSSVAKRKS